MDIWGRGTRRQAAVAALYCSPVRAGRQGGNAGRMKELREASQSATLDGAKKLPGQTLLDEMDKIEIALHSPSGEGDLFFHLDRSCRVDRCKKRIMRVAKGDPRNRLPQRPDLVASSVELKGVHRNAVRRDSTSPGVDLSKFFTVKGTGMKSGSCAMQGTGIPELGMP